METWQSATMVCAEMTESSTDGIAAIGVFVDPGRRGLAHNKVSDQSAAFNAIASPPATIPLPPQRLPQLLSIGANRGQRFSEWPDVPRQVLLTVAIQNLGSSHPTSFNLSPGVPQ